jgi:Relaxase/Mobilisation nuclease domain.
MVVSSIKPIKKSIGAYHNYIFGKPHNNKKERNLQVLGVGNCKNMSADKMFEILKYEREAHTSKKRKIDAYTLVIAFSDELDPSNANDCERAGIITQDIVEQAYPDRSAMIAIQRDGKSGLLHAHVLLNNVDNNGKALRTNGWRHLKNVTDDIAKKHGLTPLTEKKNEVSRYDWRRDLAYNIRETKGNAMELAEMGITMKKRKSKKYPPAVTSFSFIDKEGKKRNIRGRQLASQLNLPSDYFDVLKLRQLKPQNQLIKKKAVANQSKTQELVKKLDMLENKAQELIL